MPALRAQGDFYIEAEDFNYDGGESRAAASVMPYLGGAYNGLAAVHDVDYHRNNFEGSADEYRQGENPNVPMTANLKPEDVDRGSWVVTTNYRLGWINGGNWMNYTRDFPDGHYRVYAALSIDNTNPDSMRGSLQRVTSGATTTSQTLEQLGSFSGQGSGGWGVNGLVPLKAPAGEELVLHLSGPTTLRFTTGAGDFDYLKFASIAPPSIRTEPADQVAVENEPVSFTVELAGNNPASFQWQSNRVDITGATAAIYRIEATPLSANGAKYRCRIANELGAVTSREALLTVTPDLTRPTLSHLQNVGTTQLKVVFSEGVAAPGAVTPGNYAINRGVSVTAAEFGEDDRTVLLTVNTLVIGEGYELTVNNVRDRAVTPNTILPDSKMAFIAVAYAPVEVGEPGVAGSSTPVPGGFDVTGAGTDVGGTADQFHFDYQELTGNFDLRLRVEAFSPTDPFAKAGLMARESLDANSRFAATFTSPGTVGCYGMWRTVVGGDTSSSGRFPANHPFTWLRLKRSGSTFLFYASHDGERWSQLGSASLALPTRVYVGQAVTSRDAGQLALAKFRDLGSVTGGQVGQFAPGAETLSPSSRRTKVVVSEIMYHPKGRPDGRVQEFVELANPSPLFEDIGGWRISGAIDFVIPEGTILPADGFLVIARAPADVEAVYGLTGVLGPYEGALQNSSGIVRVRNRSDAIVLEAVYDDTAPWPASADGGGHSLVLARPSYGESFPEAWAASALIGGTPGRGEAIVPNPLEGVLINELLSHTDEPELDHIELFNAGNSAVDLSGCFLTDDPETHKFEIPAGTSLAPGAFVAFDQNQLGFALSAGGEAVFLIDPTEIRVIDAIRFGPQPNGVPLGRYPDGSARLRLLAGPTPGAPNAVPWHSPVIINEIMYHPLSERDEDEYVELHNRTAQPVDVSGWRFTDGIDFTIPEATSIPANGFLVVAADATNLRSIHPQLTAQNTVGDYSGRLSNAGERLALSMPEELVSTNEFGVLITNTVHIVVNEVDYRTGGRWGEWSDGGGSSLELIDLTSDNALGPNWADSDETAKATWVTAEFTGRLDNGNGGVGLNRLHLGLQGAGECLVDDVELFRVGAGNLIGNNGFESGPSGWSFYGSQSGSTVEVGGAASGNRCLHLVASGDCDTGPNTVRTSFTGLSASQTATIRAKVRWLKGWPQALFRLRGNWLELSADMQVPRNLGTPGQANSRRVANAGPAITEVVHNPILPQGGEAVLVTAGVSDPDGVGTVRLRYRQDPSTTLTTVIMRDDGTGGDLHAGDGVYAGGIPARSSGQRVAFNIQATDAHSPAATTLFPASHPDEECLVRWGDPQPVGNFTHYHLWTTSATDNAFNSINGLDNRWWDATLVHRDGRVIYNAKFRNKASPYHGGRGDFAVTVPKDDLLLGVTDRVFGQTGNANSEETAMRGQVANWMAYELGIPFLHSHYLQLYRNGSQFANVSEDLEQPNTYYAERWFPEGGEGDLYKVSVWFEFDDNNSGFNATSATMQNFTTLGGAQKLARYRWNWQRRSNDGDANNYGQLLDLMTLANAGVSYEDPLLEVADVEQWMRVHAFNRVTGNWDAWTFNVGQNMYLYRREGERWVIMPWDIDFVLGIGNGPTDGLWGGQDPTGNRMYDTPVFRRALWRAYQDAVAGPMLPENYEPQLEARSRALAGNNVNVNRDTSGIRAYIEQRRNHLQNQIQANDAAQFAITTGGGNDFTTSLPLVTLAGNAPFAAARIAVNGVPYPVRWTGHTSFTLSVPLSATQNQLVLTALDEHGNPVAGLTDTITVTYTGELQRPEDYLVISEIMYHPATPATSFVELYNRSTQTTFDLSNWALSGTAFTFPGGTLIGPRAYLLVVNNRIAFETEFGSGKPIAGEFPGSLDNGGETIRLVRPGATPAEDFDVDVVKYDDDPPWPFEADGWGSSLQVIDVTRDNWRVANWGVGVTNSPARATPGTANSVAASLPAFPLLWINEVLPENTVGLTDSAGDHDPWVEIYNAGDTALDVGALYLTDDYATPLKWRFPSVVLPAKAFLVVWADGEPGESQAGEPHTSFRLPAGTGSVALTWQASGTPAVLDYVNYRLLSPDRAYGSHPDGQPLFRQVFHYPTPGAANNPASLPVQVFINEWMAVNSSTITDPTGGGSDDWFELFNAGPELVDLTGYTLSDDPADPTKAVIPAGTVIQPGDFLLVWADEDSGQTVPGGDLHVSFKLSSAGEAISLHAPDGSLVDEITFGAQTADVSEGRSPDGAPGPFGALPIPTPGQANDEGGGNLPPVLGAIGSRVVQEGSLLGFTATATDDDVPAQTLTFSLAGGPAGSSIDPLTGVFSWRPTEAQGPGSFPMTVWVVDDGVPVRSDAETFMVTVNEANAAPALASIPNLAVDEGQPVNFIASVTDTDLPANTLSFSFVGGVPEGATLDPATGAFSWTPSEAQGPSAPAITIRVTDDGTPQLSAQRTFTITVREINNPPVIDPLADRPVSEHQTLLFTVTATDPDNPPAALRYSLDPGAPEGATIDPVSGAFAWSPSEAQGPGTYPISIRVTEQDAGGLSSARVVTLTVLEENEAPDLATISDRTVVEGDLLALRLEASDPDLPVQNLTFSLGIGAPEGMELDPATGWLVWPVPVDHQPALNDVTVSVTDDGNPPRTAEQSFRVTVEPGLNVVINEVMYAPVRAGAQFVELHNLSTTRAAAVGGLRLQGNAMTFDFTEGAEIPAGGFVTVVANAGVFASEYPGAPAPIGSFNGSLTPAGEHLKLVEAGDATVPDYVWDECWFRNAAPWPAAATGPGGSLQLVDPFQDNRRPANWDAVAGLVPTQPTDLVTFTDSWRYHQAGEDPGTAWREPGYDDGTWSSGPGLLYVESADLPEPKGTELVIGQWTYYFRTTFDFAGNPATVALNLRTVIDDAAVFHLNGQELYRLGMNPGEVVYDTPAGRTIGDAVLEGPFELSGDLLVPGENVLAVEVHQHGLGSTDLVMGCALELIGGPVAPFTPGAPNSLARALPPFAPVWLNEVQPENLTGPGDNWNEREPWIELVNDGPLPVSLDGWFLSNSYDDPTLSAVPDGETLQPGEHRLVWADGETGQVEPGSIHTAFELAPGSGSLVLSRTGDLGPEILDYLDYSALPPDATFGNVVDANPARRGQLGFATPGEANPVDAARIELEPLSFDPQGRPVLAWESEAGRQYAVEAASEFGAWSQVGTVVSGSDHSTFTDWTAPLPSARFYRILLDP